MRRRVPGGLVDRRMGKPSPRRAAEEELQRMLQLYHEHYAGFTVRHFPRPAAAPTRLQLGYTTTRLWLQTSGAVAAAPSGRRTAGSGRAGRWSG